MAKISSESREFLKMKSEPYKTKITASLEKEKSVLASIQANPEGAAYKKLALSEEMIYIATLYITINNLSVSLIGAKDNEALNDARKVLYKAIIYLEEIVSSFVAIQYSEIEDKVAALSETSIEKRFSLVRKLGLAIRLLEDAFGDNSKWKWSFVEINGRFTTVAKNLIDMKQACKDYFEPSSENYDNSVLYIRLIKKLLDQSATQYRDRYELSTHRVDDMRLAINYLSASSRVSILLGNSEEAEEIKKKGAVWKGKMDSDQKAGISS